MDLKEESILGKHIATHWYYQNKAKALCKYLGRKQYHSVLDIGAGSGFFSRYLLAKTTINQALCIDTSYDDEYEETVSSKPLQFRKSCSAIQVDLVLLMDVLEHVNDDIALLQEYIHKVPAGAHFLITVPAFQCLWSGHDVFLEHKRRYTRKQLEQVVAAAGLITLQSSYYFATVLPIAASLRVIENIARSAAYESESSLKTHCWLTNQILSTLCQVELSFFKYNKLAGLSVFCLCKKSD